MTSRSSSMPFLALLATFVMTFFLPAVSKAAQSAPDEEVVPSSGLVYVELGPTFVTNYDGGGRLKYLKTDVTLRVRAPAAAIVRTHLPYLRNRLITLFAAQLEENLTSTEGKEALRMQALQQVREGLDLVDRPGISGSVLELYFTSFVVQR